MHLRVDYVNLCGAARAGQRCHLTYPTSFLEDSNSLAGQIRLGESRPAPQVHIASCKPHPKDAFLDLSAQGCCGGYRGVGDARVDALGVGFQVLTPLCGTLRLD